MSDIFVMPILGSNGRESLAFRPTAEDRRWSDKNHHGQTLERIRERGGLGWCELAAVLEHRPWHMMDRDEARKICQRIAATPNNDLPTGNDGAKR